MPQAAQLVVIGAGIRQPDSGTHPPFWTISQGCLVLCWEPGMQAHSRLSAQPAELLPRLVHKGSRLYYRMAAHHYPIPSAGVGVFSQSEHVQECGGT